MGMVPSGAVKIGEEAVGKGLSWRDRTLTYTGYTIFPSDPMSALCFPE
jgi:hypothetical protein